MKRATLARLAAAALTYIANQWGGLRSDDAGRDRLELRRESHSSGETDREGSAAMGVRGPCEGAAAWGRIASLIGTCKMNGAALRPHEHAIAIGELLPWSNRRADSGGHPARRGRDRCHAVLSLPVWVAWWGGAPRSDGGGPAAQQGESAWRLPCSASVRALRVRARIAAVGPLRPPGRRRWRQFPGGRPARAASSAGRSSRPSSGCGDERSADDAASWGAGSSTI